MPSGCCHHAWCGLVRAQGTLDHLTKLHPKQVQCPEACIKFSERRGTQLRWRLPTNVEHTTESRLGRARITQNLAVDLMQSSGARKPDTKPQPDMKQHILFNPRNDWKYIMSFGVLRLPAGVLAKCLFFYCFLTNEWKSLGHVDPCFPARCPRTPGRFQGNRRGCPMAGSIRKLRTTKHGILQSHPACESWKS